jgi:hypothetical protein
MSPNILPRRRSGCRTSFPGRSWRAFSRSSGPGHTSYFTKLVTRYEDEFAKRLGKFRLERIRCGSRMSVIAVITNPVQIRKIIACLDRHGRGPPPLGRGFPPPWGWTNRPFHLSPHRARPSVPSEPSRAEPRARSRPRRGGSWTPSAPTAGAWSAHPTGSSPRRRGRTCSRSSAPRARIPRAGLYAAHWRGAGRPHRPATAPTTGQHPREDAIRPRCVHAAPSRGSRRNGLAGSNIRRVPPPGGWQSRRFSMYSFS